MTLLPEPDPETLSSCLLPVYNSARGDKKGNNNFFNCVLGLPANRYSTIWKDMDTAHTPSLRNRFEILEGVVHAVNGRFTHRNAPECFYPGVHGVCTSLPGVLVTSGVTPTMVSASAAISQPPAPDP